MFTSSLNLLNYLPTHKTSYNDLTNTNDNISKMGWATTVENGPPPS